MQNLKVGTTVLILDARWHTGEEAQVISVTETGVVVEIHLFTRREVIELAPEQVIALDQIEPTTEGPFHTGDIVFLHQAAYGQENDQGQIGKVVSTFPAWQRCLVELGEAGEESRKLCNFYEISLVMPERRLPDEDYLRAIAHAVPRRGYWRRYNAWWQQQADKKLWPIDELSELYAASLAVEAQINAEIAAEVERQSQLLEQAFGELTHAQKVEKWQAEWYAWTEYRSYINESTPEEELLKAIFGENTTTEAHAEQEEDHSETPEEHGRDYGYRNTGPELLERCENHMKYLAQPENYAYDTIPFRGIAQETAADIPPAIAFQPTLPQTSLQPGEPLILPGREQALTLLEKEGEHFAAALASLASNADNATVALLLEKYADMQAREGWDDMRFHRMKSLELALFATQHREAIEAVLKEELDDKFWGDGSLYSVQGIVFNGSARPLFWDESNPWHIKADEAMQVAIVRIWTPVMSYAPRFVALLREYTFGLALFKHKETGEYYLGYLHMVPFGSYEQNKYGTEPDVPADTSINHLLDWLNQGHFCFLLGYPPRDPDNDSLEHLPDFRLPLALRELYAIHGGLAGAGGYTINPPQGVVRHLNWINEENRYLLDRFHSRNLALLPKQFVAFAPDISANAYVFDRDCLDERYDPQVADWDHETWEVSKREPFWSWFVDFAPRSLLGLDEENTAGL